MPTSGTSRAEPGSGPPARASEPDRPARILIIDDEPAISNFLRELLGLAGHEVLTAADGESAVSLLRQAPADLILTDIFMPGKEGLETIMELRRDFPGAKIVAMSGGGKTGELGYLRHALQLGAVGTLVKPFGRAEVLAIVRRALAA